MTLQRTCYFCGKPVSFRRHMSLFCSDRCEQVHRTLTGGSPHTGMPGANPLREPAVSRDTLPPPPVPGGRPRGLWRA